MIFNARFILKCAYWTARLTYVCCGFRIRPYARCSQREKRGSGQLTRCYSAVSELLVIITVIVIVVLVIIITDENN